MAWNLGGRWLEVCSCKMYCRCNLGPAEPDQGWCSGSIVFAIENGSSDGIDLSGSKVALSFQLPGDFLGGIDLARLYLDEGASDDQRRELEAIFTGKKGGVWEALGAGIKEWLPAQTAKIDVDTGDTPSFRVGDFGLGKLERMKDPNGKQAVVVNAPLGAAFDVEKQELVMGTGTSWSDPDLRPWKSLGYAAVVAFSWKV